MITPDGREIDDGTIHGRLTNKLKGLYPFMSEGDRKRAAHNLLVQYPSLEAELAPPGPRWVGFGAQVSAIPDVLYPYDPAVVKAIRREFDPSVVPVFVTKWYRTHTGAVRRCGHHAMAVANPDTEDPRPGWAHFVMLPTTGPALQITSMGLHFEDRDSRPGNGLPGDMIPWDWRCYHIMRERYLEATNAEKDAIRQEYGRDARARKNKLKADEELDHAAKSPPKMHSAVGWTPNTGAAVEA